MCCRTFIYLFFCLFICFFTGLLPADAALLSNEPVALVMGNSAKATLTSSKLEENRKRLYEATQRSSMFRRNVVSAGMIDSRQFEEKKKYDLSANTICPVGVNFFFYGYLFYACMLDVNVNIITHGCCVLLLDCSSRQESAKIKQALQDTILAPELDILHIEKTFADAQEVPVHPDSTVVAVSMFPILPTEEISTHIKYSLFFERAANASSVSGKVDFATADPTTEDQPDHPQALLAADNAKKLALYHVCDNISHHSREFFPIFTCLF
jgi:hypothetical protein